MDTIKYKTSNRTKNQKTGDIGEDYASKYLISQKHYEIVARNIHIGHAEIDIIARDQNITVFIEVRTRKKNALISGYYSISQHKKSVIKNACYKYIIDNNIDFYRFDVLEIAYTKNDFDINYYENVPLF